MRPSSHPDERKNTANSDLAKVAVQCPADTFVVKIATFAKRQNVCVLNQPYKTWVECCTEDGRL